MGTREIIAELNEALTQAYTDYIRYKTQAVVISGLDVAHVATKLDAMAENEEQHTTQLRERLLALGAVPTTNIGQSDVYTDVTKALEVNTEVERKAIQRLLSLWRTIPAHEVLLGETIEHVIQDKERHVETLETLRGRKFLER